MNSAVAMPAPRWFFRFMYDRESTAWGRRRLPYLVAIEVPLDGRHGDGDDSIVVRSPIELSGFNLSSTRSCQ